MAEPGNRATPRSVSGKRRRTRLILLGGALTAIMASGLFLAGSAAAASTAPASGAAHSAAAAGSATAKPPLAARPATAADLTRATMPAAPAGGVCGVPGIGDIGSLLGLCTAGSSGVVGDLNNVCTPSVPQPEQATAGLDSLVDIPGGGAGGMTLYDNYGVAGQYWAAYGLQCSDMTSLIGNNVAGMVFDMAKSLDRVTITVYQSAAGNGILTWLSSAVDKLISALGNAIYFPYLAVIVLLGAMWLAWQGLIRKRATRTIEGTIWMVVACVAAIWLIARPADFTGVGTSVSNSVTQVLNVAFAKLPAPTGANCLPVSQGDPQSVAPNYAFTSGNGLVDANANELWSVLVCKPWLDGELGTTVYTTGTQTPTVVNQYGRQLLWAQAIAANEQPTQAVITAKQDTYAGIAQKLQAGNPAVYPLFQGNQWTTRLEIGFSALFAAVAAGLLVLLIALTLIILKLGFLLLLVIGPFFLLVGTHPGFGRVIAIRWFEMLVGVLLKQVAVALVLSVLLYCYSLIMGTSDGTLSWALKIIMIALVTVAVFIYRKPFQHLFSAVGYGMIGSSEQADVSLRDATFGFRRATSAAAGAAGMALPGVAGYRAARWARRSAQATAAGAAGGVTGGVAGDAAAPGAAAVAADGHGAARLRPDVPPADGPADGAAGSGGPASGGAGRARHWPDAGYGGPGRSAPPLRLPSAGQPGSGGSPAGWARGQAGRGAGNGRPPVRSPSAGGGGWPGGEARVRSGSSDSGAGGPVTGAGTGTGGAGGTGVPRSAWMRTFRRGR